MSDHSLTTRRAVLRQISALVTATALPGPAASAQPARGGRPGAKFFPGFKPITIQTTGATINGVMAGQGSPILLLHGAPQSMISWRLAAPDLAKDHTVVVTDLRGYGDSSKPPDVDNHSNYSKRAMALDQVDHRARRRRRGRAARRGARARVHQGRRRRSTAASAARSSPRATSSRAARAKRRC